MPGLIATIDFEYRNVDDRIKEEIVEEVADAGFRISGRSDQYLNTKPFELDDDSEKLVKDTVGNIRSKFDVDIQMNSGESNK